MSDNYHNIAMVNSLVDDSSGGRSLYDRYGGRPFLERLNKVFYDKIYADPWMSGFFAGISQTHIESQQCDFLAQLTGGPKKFFGRMPADAHMHVMISEEFFMVRHEILKNSLIEIGTPEKEKNELLKIDLAFNKVLTKSAVAECKPRYKMDQIIDIPKPWNKAS